MLRARSLPFVVLALVGAFFIQTAQAAASCQNLTQTASERMLNPCVYVVTYPFYVPNGVSLSYLRNKASSSLNSTTLPNLSAGCKKSIVRYVCAQVYKKCDPSTNVSDTSTYNTYIYANDTQETGVGLPYLRPCVSNCWDLSSSCSADPLFKLTSLASANCYSKTNYAGNASLPQPYTYDLTNDRTKCYEPNLITLAGSTETYLRSSTPCLGLVDTFYSIPGYKVSSSFTALQLPYVMQSVINTQLTAAFKTFPAWMTSECRLATKEYFCRQYFLNPQPITVGAAMREAIVRQGLSAYSTAIQAGVQSSYPGLLTAYVTIPSYPNRSVCTHYTDVCASFRSVANSASLTPNCELVSGGLEVFPVANQTISSTVFPLASLGTSLNVQFNSDPATVFYYNEAEYVYEPTCPHGYSTYTEEQKNEKGVRVVTGSACAANCRIPVYTDNEFEYFNHFGIGVTIISIFFSAVSLLLIAYAKDWQNSVFMVIFSVCSMIASSAHLHLNSAMDTETRYCHNKVVGHRTYNDSSPCSNIGALTTYLYWVGCLLMLCMSIQHAFYCRHYFALKNQPQEIQSTENFTQQVFQHPSFVSTLLFCVLFLPLIPTLIGYAEEKYGFSGTGPWCGLDLEEAQKLFGWPTIGVCFIMYGLWIWTTVTTTIPSMFAKVEQNEEKRVEMTTSGDKPNASQGDVAPSNVAVVLYDAPTQALGDEERGQVAKKTAAQDVENDTVAYPFKPFLTSTADAADNSQENMFAFAHHPIFLQLKGDFVLSATLVSSAAIYIGFSILKIGDYMRNEHWTESTTNWTKCVFSHYSSSTPYSFQTSCGTHPIARATIAQVNLYMICVYASMLVIGPTFCLAYGYAIWRAKTLIAAEQNDVAKGGAN